MVQLEVPSLLFCRVFRGIPRAFRAGEKDIDFLSKIVSEASEA